MAVNFGSSKAQYKVHERMIDSTFDDKDYDRETFFKANRKSFHELFYRVVIGILAISCIISLAVATVAIVNGDRLKKDHIQETEELQSMIKGLKAGNRSIRLQIKELTTESEKQDIRFKDFKSAFNNTFDEVRKELNATWSNITQGIAKDIVNKTATNMLQSLVQEKLSSIFKINGWVRTRNFVFKVFTERVNYAIATKRCQNLGGRLAAEVLRHPDAVRYIINGKYIFSVSTGTTPWVGFDDIRKERRWKWIDGGRMNRDTTAWSVGEPNSGGGNEDCGTAFKFAAGRILLNDQTCTSKLHYICEVELN